jgi:DNA-binding IclR family transcriptional regulator
LAIIRDSGLAYAPDDVEVGLAAMGVPVRDQSGATVAAVSVVALTPWFGGERHAAIAAALRETAAVVEAELGIRGA